MANWQKSSHEVIQLENGAETQTCFPGEDIQMTIQMTNEDTRRCSEPLANQQMRTEATKTAKKKMKPHWDVSVHVTEWLK